MNVIHILKILKINNYYILIIIKEVDYLNIEFLEVEPPPTIVSNHNFCESFDVCYYLYLLLYCLF